MNEISCKRCEFFKKTSLGYENRNQYQCTHPEIIVGNKRTIQATSYEFTMKTHPRWCPRLIEGEFALYRGDSFIAIGDITELHEQTGISVLNLKKLSRLKNRSINGLILIKIDDEEDEE